jgi:hypothetical protein
MPLKNQCVGSHDVQLQIRSRLTFSLVQVAMVLLAHRHEDARQIWAGIWAGYPRDVDLVGREGGILTSSSLFLSHIRFVGVSEAVCRIRIRI